MGLVFWSAIKLFTAIILGILCSVVIALIIKIVNQYNLIEPNLIDNIILIVITSIKTSLLKLKIAIYYLPLYLMLGIVGLTEGLVQRHLRKLGGGRESALIYHFASRYFFGCITYSIFIYLVLPISINPEIIFFPFAIVFGLLISISVQSFKKYL